MSLTLVSFVVCPYVQRACIMLQEKGVAYEVRYVDLQNKPDWFLRISPRGKVPVLVANEIPIFESQAICEYLDETCDGAKLMPEDSIERARDRGWFQFAEDVFGPNYRSMYAKDQASMDAANADLTRGFSRLESELAGRDFLSGSGRRFGMADVALAPVFTKLEVMSRLGGYEIPAELGNVIAWGKRLLGRESVKRSVVSNYFEEARAALKRRDAYVLTKT